MSEPLEVFLLFVRLGFLAFGGGSAVLADMEREVVARGWMTHTAFVNAYAVNQLLPGPQMSFVAIVGYYAAGLPGAAAAAAGFLVPPPLLMLGLNAFGGNWSASPWSRAVRRSLGPIGVGLLGAGVYAVAPSALSPPWAWPVAASALAFLVTQPRRSPLWVAAAGAAAGLALQPG